ncbi:unnamed protein product, partial [Rhizoctonia solani]
MSATPNKKKGFLTSVKHELNKRFNPSGASRPSTRALSSQRQDVSHSIGSPSASTLQPQMLENTPELSTTDLSPLAGDDPLPPGTHDRTPSILPKATSGLFRYAISSLPAQRALINALKTLQQDAGLFPPLQTAIDYKDYKKLTSSLTSLSRSLAQHLQESHSVKMSESFERTAISVEAQVKRINEQPDRAIERDPTQAKRGEEDILNAYWQIEALFRQLQIEAELSLSGNMDQQHADSRIEQLAPSKLAVYDPRLSDEITGRAFTKDTRVQVLSELNRWSLDPDAPMIYWMSGMADTGKTTITYTFAKSLKASKSLAASFFCKRAFGECQDLGRIVPTIAYQLACYSASFRSALIRALDGDREVSSEGMADQFERLITRPLMDVKNAMPEGLVVVIDALDECNNPKGVGLILDVLSHAASGLPLKFFITSRPGPGTQDQIQIWTDGTRSLFVLHEIKSSLVQNNIELHLQEELDFMTISPTRLRRLAERCGHSFIYAATA